MVRTRERARWVAVAPKEEETTQEAILQADQRLLRLRGGWRDSKGSTYRLELSEDGTSMDVHTRRPTGEVISTPNLIRIELRREAPAGRIVWGRQGARAQYTLGDHCEESLRWEHTGRPPFKWHRDGAADGGSSEQEDPQGGITVECAPADELETSGLVANGCEDAAQSVEADTAQDAFRTLRALLGLSASPPARAAEGAGGRSAEAERAGEEPCRPPEQPAEDGRQAGLRLLRAVQSGGACAGGGDACSPKSASEEASRVAVDSSAEVDGAASAAVAEAASPARSRQTPEPLDECRVVGSAGSTTAGGSTGSTPKWPPPDLEHLEPEKLAKAAQLLFGALSPAAATPSSSSAPPPQPADGQRAPPLPPLTRSRSSSNSGGELGCVETIWQPLPERWPALPAFPLVVHWHPNDPMNQMLIEQVSRILGFHLALADLQEGSYFRSQMSSGGWVKLHVFQALHHVRALGANLRTLQRAVAGNPALELDASGHLVRIAGRRDCAEDQSAPWQ